MLTQIDLRNFKCFEVLKLPLRPLTLLAGTNASGKSSILQALALLHQTMSEHEWSESLMLNGSVVQLGSTTDVIDQVGGKESCEIGLRDDDTEYLWRFIRTYRTMSLAIQSIQIDGVEEYEGKHLVPLQNLLPRKTSTESQTYADLAARLRRLCYLTAERIGPHDAYPSWPFGSSPVVGSKGEHTEIVLLSSLEILVEKGLQIKGISDKFLRQVEARMNRLFPQIELNLSPEHWGSSINIGMKISRSMKHHWPINSRNSLSQVLPIVVAALSARKRDILLFENPEVHLHPSGQAVMGKFLAEVAATGIQVLLETHSDHVLNGIRRAIKEGILSPAETALYHFSPRSQDSSSVPPQVQGMLLDPNGNIDFWPDGFFDQFDKDLHYFAGWD